jgi:uncharacterized membrane protein YdfJ with MMPL/SSD domain
MVECSGLRGKVVWVVGSLHGGQARVVLPVGRSDPPSALIAEVVHVHRFLEVRLGELVGIEDATPVPAWLPMTMFAVLFGLSMDYEVFLLSRVREEYVRTRDNRRAVADGLASTAG